MGTAEVTGPVAAGSLSETPFAHLSLYLYRKGCSGTLVLIDASGRESLVQFREGRAQAARFAEPAPDMLSGLLPLCGSVQGSYAFYEDDLVRRDADALKGEIDPYLLIARSIDEHPCDHVVDAVLDHMGKGALRIEPGRDLKRLALAPRDSVLIDLIRAAPATIAELCEQSPLGALRTRRLLYVLIATHMVTPYDDRRNSAIYQSHVRKPSFKPPVSPASLRPQELRAADARDAQRRAATPGHSGPPAWRSLASLRPASLRPSIRGPSSPAPAVSIPVPRAPHSDAPGARGAELVASLSQVDKRCQHGDFQGALAMTDELIAADDRNPDAHAARAYVLVKQHARGVQGVPREVADSLRRALGIDPDNARALLTKGLVYKGAGELGKAIGCFRRACAADPKNLEAQRELRLGRMRRGS